MTDRRLKDLSYGRLGKPTYNAQSEWHFAQNPDLAQEIHRLLPIKEHLEPSSIESQDKHQGPGSEFKKLPKHYPELQTTESIAKDFAYPEIGSASTSDGSLLGVGRGWDVERVTGRSSTFQIFAMPYGEAGHILRVVRPRVERRAWEKGSSASISFMTFDTPDQGLYEFENGGTIRQISFSNEEDGTGTWLAVRQDTATTILRIVYGSQENLELSSNITAINNTNLVPSSVVRLRLKDSEQSHADVAFNPFYNRQIAVVNQGGGWSIWENEPRHSKARNPKLKMSKCGNLLDDYNPDQSLRIPKYTFADGWHRIFWICNLSTVIACSRTHLALFDITSHPKRLDSTEFMIAKGIEIILDVKRSAKHMNHAFVLTTSRIYWLEINLASEPDKIHMRPAGVRVISSYRHFRNENDDTMRLAILQDDFISTLIYSQSNSMMNFYSFISNETDESPHQSSHGFFDLGRNEEDKPWNKSLKSICWIPSLLEVHSDQDILGDIGLNYKSMGIRFFQPFCLTMDAGLSSTICSFQHSGAKAAQAVAPSVRQSRKFRGRDNQPLKESFIILDRASNHQYAKTNSIRRFERENARAPLMDWTHIFESVFAEHTEAHATTAQLLESVSSRIRAGLAGDDFTMGTLHQLSSFATLKENLDQVAHSIEEFFGTLPNDVNSQSNLVVHHNLSTPGLNLAPGNNSTPADLLATYQKMVKAWIASLPLATSVAIRGSKFRMIRQIAVEVCLSLSTISLQNKESKVRTLQLASEGELMHEGALTRESSPATFYSAQASLGNKQFPESSFPTPTLTQSAHSQQTSTSGILEDPAISRLRQFALSIRPRPDVGKSKILSEWPSLPGTDPSKYVYRKARTDEEEEDSEQESAKRQREVERRRRRTEKFLQRSAEMSRPATPAGGQFAEAPPPQTQIPFSSQPTQDMPMTQPDRGNHGSRKAKGKKKQRTAGF